MDRPPTPGRDLVAYPARSLATDVASRAAFAALLAGLSRRLAVVAGCCAELPALAMMVRKVGKVPCERLYWPHLTEVMAGVGLACTVISAKIRVSENNFLQKIWLASGGYCQKLRRLKQSAKLAVARSRGLPRPVATLLL